MRLKSHVKYWGRNVCVWTGISLACVAGFWLMNELGNARYVQGNGLAATFLVYLAVVGAFVSMIAVISTFQTEIPRLVSMNVTRKAAVWGLTAGHGATALLHILLGILIWCIFGVREAEIVAFIAAFIAMGGKDSFQGSVMETVTELNFWPLALMAMIFYLLTAATAAMLTRKLEVRGGTIMLDMIRKQFLIQKDDLIASALVAAGAGIFGVLLLQAIYYLKPDAAAEYVPLGTILSGGFATFFAIAFIMVQLSVYFRLTISMGGVWKYFFWAFLAVSLLQNLAIYGIVLLVHMGDQLLNRSRYPNMKIIVDIWPYLLKWGVPVIVFVVIGSMLLGALGMRFGKYAQGIFWVIWMTVCIVFPRIMGAAEEAPDSMLGRMGNAAMDFCKGVPENIWLAVLAVFSAAAMLGAYRILRKSSI